MNKCTQPSPTSQVPNHQKTLYPRDFLDNSHNRSCNPVIKLILDHCKIYKDMRYSLQRIADLTGLSLRTVRRALDKLVEAGFINKVKRAYTSCVITLTDSIKESNTMTMLKKYFIGFMALSLLCFPYKKTLAEGGHVLTLNVKYIKKETITPIKPIHFSSGYVVYSFSHEQAEPQKYLSRTEFFSLISYPKKETKRTGERVSNFTEQELLEIASYPKEAITYATKAFTKALHEGKGVSFSYMISILKKWKPTEKKIVIKKRTPQQENKEFTDQEIDSFKSGAIQAFKDKAEAAPLNPYALILFSGFKKQIEGEEIDKHIQPTSPELPPMPTPPDYSAMVPIIKRAVSVSDNSAPLNGPVVSEPLMLDYYDAYTLSSPCGFDGDYEEIMD